MPSLHNTPLSCQTIQQVSIRCFDDDDVVVIAYQTMAATNPLIKLQPHYQEAD